MLQNSNMTRKMNEKQSNERLTISSCLMYNIHIIIKWTFE